MQQKINSLKIQHFKIFGEEVCIQFDNPTVLIGANNSGKTTAIQAIALWSWAIRMWFEKKKNTKSKAERNKGVALNRLEIAQVPIKETRYFWNNARIRQNSTENIGLIITLNIFYRGKAHALGISFKYHSPDLMYCQPTDESFLIEGLLEYAATLSINLLYPMSGLSDREYVLQEEAIRTQIGSGQTATVIRNICYHLSVKSPTDWAYLVKLMAKLFSVDIKKPFVRATGTIELLYNYANKTQKIDYDLDISLAGRGQQQMLLVLAYLLSNKGSILLIDEPDAHLEILRQTQIFTLLKDVARDFDCQIILVTHSEAVLNEANTVVFVADGTVQEISNRQEYKYIKDALRHFGIEHYYKAKLNPRILYIEGSTDKDMLKAFAEKFDHPAKRHFSDKLHFYYTQAQSDESDLDRKSGAYHHQFSHFKAIKKVVPEFKGIALFDGDNRHRPDIISEDLAILYWKNYEFENYFIAPHTILSFAKHRLQELLKEPEFSEIGMSKLKRLQSLIEQELILPVLNENQEAFDAYQISAEPLQKVQFQNNATTKKLSSLLETVFERYAQQEQEAVLLRKGDYYKLIAFVEQLPQEVKEKLDKIDAYLS
jgi:predicted ATPase